MGADVAISLLEEDGDVAVTGENCGIDAVETAALNLLSEAQMEEVEMEDAFEESPAQLEAEVEAQN